MNAGVRSPSPLHFKIASEYLFSGFLVCGECGSKLVIAAGDGKRSAKRYGCPSHRYRGTCKNKLMIRVDRVEEQLLSYREENILCPEMCTYRVGLFEKELAKRIAAG